MTDQAIVSRIRQWLMRNPKPAFVRVFSESLDQPSDIPIEAAPGSRVRWADVALDLATLEPTALHALDADGNVIRVERVLGDGTKSQPEPAAEDRDIPIPPVLSTDPETIRFTHVANLLARAHETSQRTSTNFTREVIALLLNWTNRIEELLDRTEQEYRREFEARLQSQIDGVEDDDMRGAMERMFFGGGGGQGPAQSPPQQTQQRTNGASNGHAAPPRGWGG
jgi:hypothetical protein